MNNRIKNIYIPKLRFKGFADLLIRKKLNDICIIKKGDQINNSELKESGLYYYQNGGIEPSGWLDNFNNEGNAISISEGGESCGFIKWHDLPFWSGGHLYTLDINDKNINKKYIYFLLKANQKFIMKLRNGSSIPNIQKQDLNKFFLFHSNNLNEQEKIAKFFSLLDQQLSLFENKLQLIEQKFEYFLNYLFNKKTFNGKKALTLLKEISVIIKGDQINSSKLKESGLYYYQNGGIEPSGWLDDFNRGKNTISINEGGSCGIVKWHDLPFWSGGHLYTLEIKNKVLINNKYLYYLLKCNEKKITKLQKGSSLKNIQKKDLEKMNISYLTNINEQILIVKFLNVIEKQKELLRKKINFLIIKKKYFLTKIFI